MRALATAGISQCARLHAAQQLPLPQETALAEPSTQVLGQPLKLETQNLKLETAFMRIASLQPSVTVVLAEVGALDQLVACTRYCADVVDLSGRDPLIVSDSWTAKADEILAARPDIVIAAVPYQLEAIAQIIKAGARFLGLAPRTLADIYADVELIASVAARAREGREAAARFRGSVESSRARNANLPRPRVYVEEWGKPLIHSQPWVAELVEAAGGSFLGTPGLQTTAETVAAADPDVIIAAWCGAGDRVPLEKIVQRRGWQELRAVRDSRVFCISDELLNTPAPTLLCGLRALEAAIHPATYSGAPGLRPLAPTR